MKESLLNVAHEIATALYDIDAIDTTTMREYDTLILAPIHDFSATEIKKIRLREKVSQAVFALYLNISLSTVRQWEQGGKHPRGTSLKLLNLINNKGLEAIA